MPTPDLPMESAQASQLGAEPRTGGLDSAALKELWCWLWAGIAEREHRVWRSLKGTRDIRRESQATVDVLRLLLHLIPAPPDGGLEQLVHVRLGCDMPAAAAADLEAELRAWLAQAKREANGSDLHGNDGDAMELVLRDFVPLVAHRRARAAPRWITTTGGLTAAQAFRFHAWLASTIELLEEGASSTDVELAASWRSALPAMRMVLAQWVASLPRSRGRTHYFNDTWDRLWQGMGPASFQAFAGWLASVAWPPITGPDGTRTALAQALIMLARVSGRTEEALRDLAPGATPPWSPIEPLSSAFLGVHHRPGALVVGTMVDNSVPPEVRDAIPFHQFLAALDHGRG